MIKNILFLEHCVDNTIGGSHYCLLEICRSLDKNIYFPIVAFYQPNDLIDEFKKSGAKVIILKPHSAFIAPDYFPVPFKRIISKPINLFKMLFFRTLYCVSILREYNIDLLHLNNTFTTDHDAILACKLKRVPVVAHVRGIEPNIGRLSIKFSALLEAIISISNAVRINLLNNNVPQSKIKLIYDGISVERMLTSISDKDPRDEYDIPNDAIVVGIIGNVKEWKGQKVVVDAIIDLYEQDRDINVYCFIVGASVDKDYLSLLVTSLDKAGLQDKVVFTGYKKNVADYLNSFDIFIHASIEPEPFGIVILEAMSLRKPVIVSNIGAPKEIIEEDVSGISFKSGDSRSLSKAINALIDDNEKRKKMGERGYIRLESSFTSDMNAKSIMSLYKSILSR